MMADHMIIYASRSLLADASMEYEKNNILQQARVRNSLLQVTGMLIFTGHHFAQLLEGSRENIIELMKIIDRDRRHENVTILEETEISERQFGSWSMGYSGASIFVDQIISRAMHEAGGRALTGLRDLQVVMKQFALPS